MKLAMSLSTAAAAVASALALAGCATSEDLTRAPYGNPVSGSQVESVPARTVVVERAPAREVVIERAPAREVVVERVPAERVVVAPAERVYVAPADTVIGGRALGRDAAGQPYDREIVLGPNTTQVTVNRDETVKFYVPAAGRSFVWQFNTSQENVSFPLSNIVPSDIRTHPNVVVHVVGPGRPVRPG